MSKKLLIIFLAFALLIPFAACDKKDSDLSSVGGDSSGAGSGEESSDFEFSWPDDDSDSESGGPSGDTSLDSDLSGDSDSVSNGGPSQGTDNDTDNGGGNQGGTGGQKPDTSSSKPTSPTPGGTGDQPGQIGKHNDIYITVIGKGLGDQWLKDVAEVYTRETGNRVHVYSDPNLIESLAEKMNLGSSKVDDIYFTWNSEWPKWTDNMVDLTDIFKEVNDNSGKTLEDKLVNSALKEFGVKNNKRYLAPIIYPPTGLVYNKTYLQQLGYSSFPDTWEGLLELSEKTIDKKIMNKGQQVRPFAWGATVNDLDYMYRALWYQLDPAKFKAYWSYSSKTVLPKDLLVNNATKGALEAIHDLLDPRVNNKGEGYSNNSIAAVVEKSNLQAQEAFINGYAVFCATGSWFKNEMSALLKNNPNLDYGFAPFPKLAGASKTSTVINVPGEYFFIPADSKNVAGAKDFLRYVFREKSLISIQQSLELPVAYRYYSSQGTNALKNLTGWAKDCYTLVDKSDNVLAFSGSDVFQTGALRDYRGGENTYVLIAQNKISKAQINGKLESYYNALRGKWDKDYMSQID